MSTIRSSTGFLPRWHDKVMQASWPTLANGDDGTPEEFPSYSDRSVQVVGTFGAGGNCRIEGSLDGVNWSTLNDPQGNPLDITSTKIESIMELVYWIRPRITAGDGTTSLTVTMIMRRN